MLLVESFIVDETTSPSPLKQIIDILSQNFPAHPNIPVTSITKHFSCYSTLLEPYQLTPHTDPFLLLALSRKSCDHPPKSPSPKSPSPHHPRTRSSHIFPPRLLPSHSAQRFPSMHHLRTLTHFFFFRFHANHATIQNPPHLNLLPSAAPLQPCCISFPITGSPHIFFPALSQATQLILHG